VKALILATAVLAPAIHAESLEQAWQQALAHDSAYAAASADTERAQANERAALGTRWPALTASGGYTRFATAPQLDFSSAGLPLQAPLFTGDDYGAGNVQLTLPLFTSGRISAGIDAARQGAVSASEAERAELAALRMAVAETYIEVLRALRRQHTADSTVVSLAAHTADVASLVERELVARSDLLAARVALSNAEQQQVHAANAVALAYAAYNRRLGEPLDRKPDLDETLRVDARLAGEPLESLVRRALESRAEVSSMSAQANALAEQAMLERSAVLPQVSLTGGYTYLENEVLDRQDFSAVGVAFTWNLFDGGQARNRSAALRSASRAAQLRVADLRTLVELQVREAWLNVREAHARLAASRDAVAQADENLRISRELYGTGLATNTQVLDAVTLQISATSNRDNASLDESMSQLRLARAVGTL